MKHSPSSRARGRDRGRVTPSRTHARRTDTQRTDWLLARLTAVPGRAVVADSAQAAKLVDRTRGIAYIDGRTFAVNSVRIGSGVCRLSLTPACTRPRIS